MEGCDTECTSRVLSAFRAFALGSPPNDVTDAGRATKALGVCVQAPRYLPPEGSQRKRPENPKLQKQPPWPPNCTEKEAPGGQLCPVDGFLQADPGSVWVIISSTEADSPAHASSQAIPK